MSPNDLSLPALPATRHLRSARSASHWRRPRCSAPRSLLDNYCLHAIIIAMIFLLPAHGLNLIVGYTGMLSLAQGAFFGIGAYTSA